MPSLKECLPLSEIPGEGAADACAFKGKAYLGGWFSSMSNPSLRDIKWFSLELSPEGMPSHFEMNSEPQRDIAFWEALAQAVLLLLRVSQIGAGAYTISLKLAIIWALS